MADRTAVLTGVTGGWGRAVLDRFLAEGWNVVVTYREEQPPADLPTAVAAVRADLSDPDAAVAAVATPRSSASAGSTRSHTSRAASRPRGTIDEQPVDVWRSQMAINLDTAYFMTRAVLPADAGGRPRLDRLHRDVGDADAVLGRLGLHRLQGGPGRAHALRGRRDSARPGIRANAIVVKIVDTPRNRAENPDADHSRWTTGAELAEVVEWLCTDASAPLSGGLIPAYGRA